MYIVTEPPYFLLIAGFLAGVTSGLAFQSTLKLLVNEWSKNRATHSLTNLRGIRLFTPFMGIIFGICIFLGSGLEVFGFPRSIAYAASFPLTLLTAWLVWSQLGKVLIELETGGSKALDLDGI
jgi:hypothetical protein